MTMILLVDDSSRIRTECKAQLERDGYKVVLTGDGDQAVTKLRRHRPDLVIFDIGWRHADAFDAMLKISRLTPDLPMIVLGNEDYRHRRADLPPHTYLDKMGDYSELKAVVTAMLAPRSCQPREVTPMNRVQLFELLESLDVGRSARAVLLDWQVDGYVRTSQRIVIHDFVGRSGQPGSRGYCVQSPISKRWEVTGGLASKEYHPVGFIL